MTHKHSLYCHPCNEANFSIMEFNIINRNMSEDEVTYCIWTIIVITILSILYYVSKISKRHDGKNICGPKGWPLVGNAFEIKSKTMAFAMSEWADKYGDIFVFKMLGHKMISLNSVEMLKKAFLREPFSNVLNDRPPSYIGEHLMNKNKDLVLSHYGPTHKKLRMAFHRGLELYGDGVARFERTVGLEVDRLVALLDTQQGVDVDIGLLLRTSLTNLLSILLCGKPLITKDDDENIFWNFLETLRGVADPGTDVILRTFPFLRHLPFSVGKNHRKILKSMTEIREKFINRAMADYNPGEIRGLIDAFLSLRDDKSNFDITDENIECTIFDVIMAGFATSYRTIMGLFLCLLNNPKYQENIFYELRNYSFETPLLSHRHEYPYLKATIHEALRLLTPVPFGVPHVSQTATSFEGIDLRKGDIILPNIWYIHHNEALWEDPFTFNPERFLDDEGKILPLENPVFQGLVPFGVGKRQCIGETFAKSRIFIYLIKLFKSFKIEKPEAEEIPSCDPRTFTIGAIITFPDFKCRLTRRK